MNERRAQALSVILPCAGFGGYWALVRLLQPLLLAEQYVAVTTLLLLVATSFLVVAAEEKIAAQMKRLTWRSLGSQALLAVVLTMVVYLWTHLQTNMTAFDPASTLTLQESPFSELIQVLHELAEPLAVVLTFFVLPDLAADQGLLGKTASRSLQVVLPLLLAFLLIAAANIKITPTIIWRDTLFVATLALSYRLSKNFTLPIVIWYLLNLCEWLSPPF